MADPFTVIFFETEKGEVPVLQFLNTLEVKLRAKVFRDLQLLEQKGNDLRLPWSEHLDDGIFELRTIRSTVIIRCFYFFLSGKKIVVTHGFKKKTRKTPQNEIIRAKKYREDYFKRGNRR